MSPHFFESVELSADSNRKGFFLFGALLLFPFTGLPEEFLRLMLQCSLTYHLQLFEKVRSMETFCTRVFCKLASMETFYKCALRVKNAKIT